MARRWGCFVRVGDGFPSRAATTDCSRSASQSACAGLMLGPSLPSGRAMTSAYTGSCRVSRWNVSCARSTSRRRTASAHVGGCPSGCKRPANFGSNLAITSYRSSRIHEGAPISWAWLQLVGAVRQVHQGHVDHRERSCRVRPKHGVATADVAFDRGDLEPGVEDRLLFLRPHGASGNRQRQPPSPSSHSE